MSEVSHSDLLTPSTWVIDAISRIKAPSRGERSALDLACGSGRHALYLAEQGYEVLAVDKNLSKGLDTFEQIEYAQMDLEAELWPLSGKTFDLIVVTNYLYRPYFDALLRCLKPGGALVYETFMQGNEEYGRPRNPDFLLRPGELLALCKDLSVLAFEQGLRAGGSPAMIQRIVAVLGDWSEIQSHSKLNSRR
ncbi:MAG: class I SAM-dependent methyltransferase [Limnobacter sp.]|nr:class I SAM-dependent methyltransferase [Limnobacter sp.]